ncbi:MAG TPA: nicotinamide riboside transporter PnuC [Steroidobacteraceae bacterium]|nr:nicotinamide riboside transporter PnuC [Steroidobacteraceae bacterium]
MEPAELAAVAFGVAYILLAIRERRSCWIAGGISTAIYAVVFWRAGLPMQAALQLVYVALSAWGWFAWGRAGAEGEARRWPALRHVAALAAIGLLTAVSAPLAARYALAAAPVADSLGTWASLFATWLLARRIIDTWAWWIAIDLGLGALFIRQGLLPTGALYLAFALLAIAGWQSWRRPRAPA